MLQASVLMTDGMLQTWCVSFVPACTVCACQLEWSVLVTTVQQLQLQLEAFLAPSSSHGGTGSAHSGSATRG